ncbi:hypothetical protein K6T82_20570, partial [Flavobacterium sp. 17A]
MFEKACVTGIVVYFCTRNNEKRSLNYWQADGSKEGKTSEKKDSKKLARFENAFYICTPQNTESSLIDCWGKRGKRDEKKVSKFFKFFLQETKTITSFAPALRNKRKTQNYV